MPPYKTALATDLQGFCRANGKAYHNDDDGLVKNIIDIVNYGKERFSDRAVAQTGVNTPPSKKKLFRR